MDDIPDKLRRYYDTKSLSNQSVERILARGRQQSKVRFRRVWLVWAAAALFLFSIGGVAYHEHSLHSRVANDDVERAIQTFFNQPDYQFAQLSSHLAELQSWLKQHGEPDSATVPADLSKLTTYGCQILQVKTRSLYLLCFLLDGPDVAPGQMMKKKAMMAVQNADGTMMKKSLSFVHFVTVPRSAFINPPPKNAPAAWSERGDWKFARWSRGDVVYFACGNLAEERLRVLLAKL